MSDPTTILVVDDNPATLYTTSRVLRSAGFDVLEAKSGGQALDLAGRGVDLVVLDVKLPDIDGFEVCRRLRANGATGHVPVVHLSATFVKDADKVYGLQTGAIGYLTHPIEPPVLIATISAFLRARRAEHGLRQSEARFRAVFDHALNGIVLMDRDLRCLEANRAIGELLGRAQDEIVGHDFTEFVPVTAKGRDELLARLRQTTEWRGTFPLEHRDGSFVQVEWSVSSHSMSGVRLVIVTDISERVRIEEQRTELLASERAARAEAERANRLKDDFLATLSHELRTPLGAIVGWAQVLRRLQPLSSEFAEGLEAIERNSKIQTQMISDLLDVSRITSGKLSLDMRMIDPADSAEAALASVRPAAASKGIRVEKKFAPAAGPIHGDASRLQQVIWNLLSNAVKFTPKGGHIAIEIGRMGSHVQIAVRDDGQGIKREFLPYVFERFRQGDSQATRVGGLGIGLAIVKHLTEMHGGTVAAESAGEGRGAAFLVNLPLAALKAVQEPGDTVVPVDSPNRLSGLRVVVVDDDADTRRLLQRILEDADAEVRTADSVDAALVLIESFAPQILVSDIGMAGRDGYDLIRAIRANGYNSRSLPAIALTAFARTEERRRALLAGYQVHIAKPVDTHELIATIASLAGRTGAELSN